LVVNLRGLSTSNVNIGYTVSYNIAVLGYSGDPNGAYNSLFNSLNTSVTSGNFNSYLTTNSATYNATDLSSATTQNVQSSGYSSVDSNDDTASSSGNKKLSERKKIIIGVVVGVGGFLIIMIGAMVAYCWNRRSVNEPPPAPTAAGPGGRAFEAVSGDHVEMVIATPTDKKVDSAI